MLQPLFIIQVPYQRLSPSKTQARGGIGEGQYLMAAQTVLDRFWASKPLSLGRASKISASTKAAELGWPSLARYDVHVTPMGTRSGSHLAPGGGRPHHAVKADDDPRSASAVHGGKVDCDPPAAWLS